MALQTSLYWNSIELLVPEVPYHHVFTANYLIFHNSGLSIVLPMNTDFHWISQRLLLCIIDHDNECKSYPD